MFVQGTQILVKHDTYLLYSRHEMVVGVDRRGDFTLHSDLKTAVRLPGSRARVRKSGTLCHCSVI